MNIPIMLFVVITLFDLIFSIKNHGKAKTGKHDVRVTIIASFIVWVLLGWALGWRI